MTRTADQSRQRHLLMSSYVIIRLYTPQRKFNNKKIRLPKDYSMYPRIRYITIIIL